jgi:hypothetical protein
MPERAGSNRRPLLTAAARRSSIRSAMSQPSHIYSSTVRRKRAVWPYAVAAIAFAALAAAVLL